MIKSQLKQSYEKQNLIRMVISYTVLIRCAVMCVLNARDREFQCILANRHQKLTTPYTVSNRANCQFDSLQGTSTPNQYSVIWNLWNSPKARFINFIWIDHSCKMLYIFQGSSASWWNQNHYRHHAKPNVVSTAKLLKIQTPEKIFSNYPKIWLIWIFHRVIRPNDHADGMANSLICIFTVCSDLSVRKFRNSTEI